MNLKNCDAYKLKEIALHRRLICFGMGRVFKDFLSHFSNLEFEKDIWAVIDNRIEKEEEVLLANGVSVKVMNPKNLFSLKNIIILISCADIIGVYEQLKQYKLSDEIDCYVAYFVRSETNRTDDKNRVYPQSFKITKEQRVPKRIHYCWFGDHPIPQKNLRWIESWRKYCPDYEIIQWNESNYDITKNEYMHEAYKLKKWGFVSDYARLDIIFHYGGIYLDTDVEIVKAFDELLYQKAFVGVEANRRIALGLGFGAEEGFPIIKQLLDLYEGIHFIDRYGNSNLNTCVALQFPFFKEKGFIDNGEYQIVDALTVFPETVFAPKDFYTGELRITNHTFSIHHYDASWVGKKESNKILEARQLFLTIKKEMKS